ncbi:alpha/beta hydrolase [Sphingomonas sp. M1-B02]|uniref:alpha/beta hydrolase n=1 Tax=Sphingomonas sp. M1-B02 TaxID=3114300 RepID=UPI002240C8CC|nr:alpha/beta hydrolase [Sphingomonas sp. S6-11]UZK65567.1 alpha/beta hydrolase [Sphingomonas sp. S6-11]
MVRLLAMLCSALALIGPALAQQPPPAPQRIALWADGAPGFESRKSIPEQSEAYRTKPINDPSITYFPARAGRETGAAVVLMPGGAHEFLVITSEGNDAARWFNERGIAAFVLRYRLFRGTDSPYKFEHARQDAERAMRLIRSRADTWKLDPKRIGVVGFSAGGELARVTLLSPPLPAPGKGDAVDRLSARPDFGVLVFPGPLHAEEKIDKDSPPLLMTATNDDACCSQPIIDLLNAYRAAGASSELHMYAAGGHAFNMGETTPMVSLRNWPARITDWMTDRGLLAAWKPVSKP